nr:cupin domain-containing protein [Enterobacter sp. E1]
MNRWLSQANWHSNYQNASYLRINLNVALVIDGRLELSVKGNKISVTSGQLYVAKAGVPHSVEPGSSGILVIIDLPETEVA